MSMASYPGDSERVTRPATKPVSGEAIVSSLDRMDAISEHGTKAGYGQGCRGSHCPGKDRVGMSCSQASIRYAGDMSYRRRVDAGLSAEAIWAEDQLEGVVMPKASKADRRAESVYDGEQSTVEDSVEDFDDDEELADAVARGRQSPATKANASVVAAGPAEPVRARRWAVRRVWVAIGPDGVMHGPHESQLAAVAFVGERLPKPSVTRPRRAYQRVTDAERVTWRRLHREGMSTTKIAQKTGRSLTVVAREMGKMGLAANGKRFGEKRS